MDLATRRAVLGGCLAAALGYSLAALVADRYVTAEGAYRESFFAEHRGDTARRVDALRRGLKAYPLCTRLLLNAGRYYWLHKGDHATAARVFALSSIVSPFGAGASACHGDLALMQGRLDEAAQSLERAVQRDPQFGEAWYALGAVYIFQKRLNKAIAANQRAVHIDPLHSMAWMNLGVALHNTGRLMESIRADRMAVAIDPDRDMFNFNLGVHIWEVDREESLAALQRAVRANPESHRYLEQLCSQAVNLDREDVIRAAGEQLARLPNPSSGHYLALGNAFSSLGCTNDALTAFHKALALDPRNKDAEDGITALTRPVESSRQKVARADSQKGNSAQRARTYNDAAWIDYKNHNYADAIESCRKAIALDPTNARYLYLLAECVLSSREITDKSEAITALRKAVLLEPSSMEYRMTLARELDMAGQHHAAAGLLANVELRVDPDSAVHEEARSMLTNAQANVEAYGVPYVYKQTNGLKANIGAPSFSQDDITGSGKVYAYKSNPDDECYLVNVAWQLAMQDRFDLAEDLINKACAARPTHPCPDWIDTDSTYFAVAETCFRSNQDVLGERTLRFLMKDSRDAHNRFKAAERLAYRYLKVGRGEEAVALLEEAMAKRPDKGEAYKVPLERFKEKVAKQTPPGAAR